MKQYLDIVKKVMHEGIPKKDRTGVGTIAIPGAYFEHDMSKGFPLLTTKKIAHKTMRVELEGFLKGITDKRWYQERGCHIWDEWCTPKIVPYGHGEEIQRKMAEERDLGPLYGWQWRHFGAVYEGYDKDYSGKGEDQLVKIIKTLKENPDSRRMVVNAWNAEDLNDMALEPCHYGWQIDVLDGKLNLSWNQRSVDTMLGLPFNIASYGLLLHLLAKESGLKEGMLMGFLRNVHIYNNHMDGAREQLQRQPFSLPKVESPGFTSILDWNHNQTIFLDYQPYPKIDFPIAV